MRKNESGRSMVEMLGVLAIIGVLSIGGIAGYMLSMNRFRANDLIDKASKFATLAYSTKQSMEAQGNSFTASNFTWEKAKIGTLGTNEAIALASSDTFTDKKNTEGKVIGADVSVTITFPSEAVCDTAVSITGTTSTCTSAGEGKGYSLTLAFTQS